MPAAGTARTRGSPPPVPVAETYLGSGLYLAGRPSIPAKMAARMTEMKVKKAETVANLARVSNVLSYYTVLNLSHGYEFE